LKLSEFIVELAAAVWNFVSRALFIELQLYCIVTETLFLILLHLSDRVNNV